MQRNIGGQKLTVYAFDSTTNAPKTGDAANITAYVNKDDAGVVVLADSSATEISNTNAKGYYTFDLAQGETDAYKLHYTGKSVTANVVIRAVPEVAYTVPSVGDVTLSPSTIRSADMTGTVTLASNGTYWVAHCFSIPASGSYWVIDLNSKTGGFNIFDHRGGIRLSNLKAGMFVSIHGSCSVYVDTTCTGGIIRFFGPHFIRAGAGDDIDGEAALAAIALQNVTLQTEGLVTRDGINAEVVDVVSVDTLVAGVSMAESLRRIGAITSGKISTANTGTETYKDYAESIHTVVVSVDAQGNRTAVAYS